MSLGKSKSREVRAGRTPFAVDAQAACEAWDVSPCSYKQVRPCSHCEVFILSESSCESRRHVLEARVSILVYGLHGSIMGPLKRAAVWKLAQQEVSSKLRQLRAKWRRASPGPIHDYCTLSHIVAHLKSLQLQDLTWAERRSVKQFRLLDCKLSHHKYVCIYIQCPDSCVATGGNVATPNTPSPAYSRASRGKNLQRMQETHDKDHRCAHARYAASAS